MLEDRATFRAFAAGLWEYLQPVGALECFLADRIVASAWRLRRVHVIEGGLFEGDVYENGPVSLTSLFVEHIVDPDSVSTLSRYEAAIERGLFRALHELERLQTRRLGGNVPPPAAMDVDVALQVDEGVGR